MGREQPDAYYAAQSLTGNGYVTWAGDGPVPNWFDLAQDLTERWGHQMQMREAIGKVGTNRDDYLADVLRTFVWAFPHQFRPAADLDSTILLDLGAGGIWTLTSDGAWWDLEPGATAETHVVEVYADDDTGWRWLTGGGFTEGALRISGPPDLVVPLLQVRAILV